MPLILSASLAMGALLAPASSTRRIIWESVLSSPTFNARIFKAPFPLIEAESTGSPADFFHRNTFPVRADSSTVEWPSSTCPSTGIAVPGG